MARKDVIQFFLEQQNVYNELLENVKEFDVALKKGILTEEQVEDAKKEVEIIKENYQLLAYVVLLLNKPHKKNKRLKEERANHQWYEALKGSSREALLDESRDALTDFKRMVKEIKENK